MNECSVSADASGNFLFTISHFDSDTAAEVVQPFRNFSFIYFDSNCAKKCHFILYVLNLNSHFLQLCCL